MKSLDKYTKNRFQNHYISQLYKKPVKKGTERWYVIRVEQYVKSIPDRKVLEHTPDDVQRFFSVIGRKSKLKGWQFYQQVEALQILFCDVLKTSWCHQIDWNYWYASAKELHVSHPTIARESTSCTHYDQFDNSRGDSEKST